MFLKMFARLWRVENSMKEIAYSAIDLIVPICYGAAKPDRLARGTELNLGRAIGFMRTSPQAILAFGNCPYIFPGAEKAEAQMKKRKFPAIFSMRKIEVSLNNSVEEAENIRKAASEQGIEPRCILILTGEFHSRSARFIWQRVFPSAKILVSCIGYRDEVDADHLVFAVRTPVVWALANVARQFLLRTVGLSIRKIHHYVAE